MRTRHEASSPRAPWRAVYAGPLVALGALALAFVVCTAAGVPLRDPDGVAGGRLLVALSLVIGLVVLDVGIRSAQRSAGRWPGRAGVIAGARGRRDGSRGAARCPGPFSLLLSPTAPPPPPRGP